MALHFYDKSRSERNSRINELLRACKSENHPLNPFAFYIRIYRIGLDDRRKVEKKKQIYTRVLNLFSFCNNGESFYFEETGAEKIEMGCLGKEEIDDISVKT